MRVETRFVDDDEGLSRVHVTLNGQDCGPSVLCDRQWYEMNRDRLKMMLQQVADRSEATGESNAKQAIRAAIGAKG